MSNLEEHEVKNKKQSMDFPNSRQLKVCFIFERTCAYLLSATIHPSSSLFCPSSLLLIQHLRFPPPALHSAPSLLSPSLHPCQLPWNAAFTRSAKGTIGRLPGNGPPLREQLVCQSRWMLWSQRDQRLPVPNPSPLWCGPDRVVIPLWPTVRWSGLGDGDVYV